MEKLLGLNCQNSYDQLQKQLGFHPSKGRFTIIDEFLKKLLYFFIQTCNSHICDFIWLYQQYSRICDYNSHIYNYTHLQPKWHIGVT